MLLVSSLSAQVRPTQADSVVRLLTDIENAMSSNNVDEFIRLTGATLPTAEMSALASSLFREKQTSAAVRERDRRPAGTGYALLVEILIAQGDSGRIVTWELRVQPKADDTTRYEIVGATPIASVDGLAKLKLDTTKQFAPHDLVITSPGLTLHLSSGSVFLAHVEDGTTALLFRGKGTMRFAPDDPAEQIQVRAFSGKPAMDTPLEAVYLRLNPYEFSNYVASSQLEPAEISAGEVARARALFDELSVKSYTLSLNDLTTDRWSLSPQAGYALAEIRTGQFGNLTYVRAKDDAEDVSLFDRARGRNISVFTSAERLAARGRYFSEDDTATYDVLHYEVDVRFDPEREWVSGRGALKVRTRRDGLTSLTVKLTESLGVSSVSSPTFGRLLALRISGQSGLLVTLPRALPSGTELVLEMAYSGRLPSQGIEREAMALDADQQQPQPPLPSLDQPILPEPRYLYSNRSYWYPQSPVTDFATASLRLTVPAQFQVVAAGSLVSSVVTPENLQRGRNGDERAERTVQFVADRPVRYLACVISRFVPVGGARAEVPAIAAPEAGGEVARRSAPGAVTVDVVATPRLLRANRGVAERTAGILQYYASIIGEAPYPDFSLATLDAELPSGHSPAYFAIWNQPSLPTNLSWRNDPVALTGHPFYFLAHEVAHQWWGQAIGWKNYHEQWLSEGLAQYFAAIYAGHDRGAETERALFRQMRDSALSLSRHGPIHLGYRLGHVQNDGRIFRGLVYNKSAVVLDMLQRLIGPEAFTRGIQRFYRTHRFTKAGTEDLKKAFEAETAVPLGRFFDRWIHGFTVPEVRMTWRMADDTHVAVRIEQTGEAFDFPLTLTIQHSDGRIEQVPAVVTTPVHDALIPVATPVRRVDTRDDVGLVIVKR
ncbi:MAG TPA: M1 family aminopeptidase [Vicinamibacterales bacterium]|nr:M1 family aminopeptidase [Vicinamibacterales bacterium]